MATFLRKSFFVYLYVYVVAFHLGPIRRMVEMALPARLFPAACFRKRTCVMPCCCSNARLCVYLSSFIHLFLFLIQTLIFRHPLDACARGRGLRGDDSDSAREPQGKRKRGQGKEGRERRVKKGGLVVYRQGTRFCKTHAIFILF